MEWIQRGRRLKSWAGDSLIWWELGAEIPLMSFVQSFLSVIHSKLCCYFAVAGSPHWDNSEAATMHVQVRVVSGFEHGSRLSNHHPPFVICPCPWPHRWHQVHWILYHEQCVVVSNGLTPSPYPFYILTCWGTHTVWSLMSIASPCSILHIRVPVL